MAISPPAVCAEHLYATGGRGALTLMNVCRVCECSCVSDRDSVAVESLDGPLIPPGEKGKESP